jgi:membrane-associated PAP2 superfamily phosphatase
MGYSRISPATRFYFWRAVLPLFAAIVLLKLFDITDIDLRVSDFFYDPGAHKFPLQHSLWLELVLHDCARYLLVLIAFSTLAACVVSLFTEALRSRRRTLLFLCLALVTGAGTVSVLRQMNNAPCPRDLSLYGGYAPYPHLLESSTDDMNGGHCSPSRHAAGGFGLMAFYFALRRKTRLSRIALMAGIGSGLILGIGRIAQGAAFLSSTLEAGFVVWFVALAVYRLILHSQHFTSGARLTTLPFSRRN